MNGFEYTPPKNAPVETEALLRDLQSVANTLNINKLSQRLYSEHGKYHTGSFKKRFGTWNKALLEAGLEIAKIDRHSNETLFENILNVWQKNGKQPRQGDIDSHISEISSGVHKKRFGSWTTAIKEFINYANEKDVINSTEGEGSLASQKKTPRGPSLRLRFNVLKRDNFTCVQCGASPAKDPSVELHIDHIKPWSKEGETVLGNLQTLCSQCNLGKSNL